MTLNEAIKIQADFLKWQANTSHSIKLMYYKDLNNVWLTDGMMAAKMPSEFYMLNIQQERANIMNYSKFPDDAIKALVTYIEWKSKGPNTYVMIKGLRKHNDVVMWAEKKYLEAFGKKYDLYISSDGRKLWLTEPETRNVVGVIAGVRGIKM